MVSDLSAEVKLGLQRPQGKRVPFCLLYDNVGSQLYTKITCLDSYYLFAEERSLLDKCAEELAALTAPGTLLVELGCGNAEKAPVILEAFLAAHGSCHYVGIDISASALEDAAVILRAAQGNASNMKVDFVHAGYLEGLACVRQRFPGRKLCILWLGSGIGNLTILESVEFLKQVVDTAGNGSCQVFICTDMWKDVSKLHGAYKDEHGITKQFIKNGMKNALKLVDHEASSEEIESWEYIVEVNGRSRQVEMYIGFKQGLQTLHDISIREGERVLVEISRKFTDGDVVLLAKEAGLVVNANWGDKAVYAAHLLA